MKAQYWHELEDGRLECELCPRACKLAEDMVGFCQSRKAVKHSMELLTYGHASGLCLDPIEKKPLYHFYPGTKTLSFGTVGCNLACKCCQNWHLSRAKAEEVQGLEYSPQAIVQAAIESKAKSVSFTYNEPVTFAEYAIETAKLCRKNNLRTVAVSSGYIHGKAREDFFSVMDAANVDLKGFSEEFYHKYCSASLAPVLETLKYIAKQNSTWLELTTLLIPGANDSEEELQALAHWVFNELGSEVPLHFTAYHPAYLLMDRNSTPLETLIKARAIALKQGLKYVYTGNVYDPEGSRTCCPSCQTVLIEREGLKMKSSHLTRGACFRCGAKIEGAF